MDAVLVHDHEIFLKGKNRPFFTRQLVANLKAATAGLGVLRVTPLQGRIALPLAPGAAWAPIRDRLQTVFGISNFVPAFRVAPSMEALKARIGQEMGPYTFDRFCVRAKRADKAFPLNSEEINRQIGTFVQEISGAKVALSQPEMTLRIEVLPTAIFFSFEKVAGIGGLPVGVSGTVAALLSGGIDSPVAAFRMMKRGCRVCFVHFHGRPYVSGVSREKALDLAEILNRYQTTSRLYLVPFGALQREIVTRTPMPDRVVLYRRLMCRIAAEIACREGAKALVTGDSVGQVASQTLDNLATVEEASPLPIFRPLIGMDKEEIIVQAQAIGVYETAILPDEDCCRLFVPKHPSTRTTVEAIRRVETRLEIARMVEDGLKEMEIKTFP